MLLILNVIVFAKAHAMNSTELRYWSRTSGNQSHRTNREGQCNN